MPRDLFQPAKEPESGLGRRAGVLPVSIAAHLVAIGAAVLVPAIAIGALPDPRISLAYVTRDVLLPAVPIAPPSGGARAHRSGGAPTVAPSHLPAPGEEPLPDVPAYDGPPVTGGLPMGDGDGVPGGMGRDLGALEMPPPPPAPPRLVHVGGDIRPPVKVRDVAPVYPDIARSARVEGIVIIEAVIDARGQVVDTRLLRSVPLLDQAALDAVRQWVYTPTRLNGQPTAVVMTVTVRFTLN